MENKEKVAAPAKVFIFPFTGHGHFIPAIDMAKLFTAGGAETTVVATVSNVPFVSNAVEKSKMSGKIKIETLNFPCEQIGLPEGSDSVDLLASQGEMPSPDTLNRFFNGMALLQPQLEKLLDERRPDCLIADLFYPWATEASGKFGIPRLVFHGTSFFSLCAMECMRAYDPRTNVSSDSDPFVIPDLPGDIVLMKSQLPHHTGKDGGEEESALGRIFRESFGATKESFGVVVNSFYELEHVYADYYRNVLKIRAWHIGPVSLCNRRLEEKAERGKKPSIDPHERLKWLDSKEPNSVIYLCFGSVANFTDAQLMEIAKGLEDSGQKFIWVVRRGQKGKEETKDEWLPEGFKERTKEKGLIIRGWAPQVLLLEHQAIGGFVTHCGWNSTLEGIAAGVPMVTWPVSGEQFYNEKLLTQVLKIGVQVGAQKWAMMFGDYVTSDKVKKAVEAVMVGKEAEERRNRAQEFQKMAQEVVEEGGSSYKDLKNLINDLINHRHEKNVGERI